MPDEDDDNPMEEIMQEMLYLLVRYKFLDNGITPGFRHAQRRAAQTQKHPRQCPKTAETGWRRQMLGEDIFLWMKHYERLEMSVASGRIELRVREE